MVTEETHGIDTWLKGEEKGEEAGIRDKFGFLAKFAWGPSGEMDNSRDGVQKIADELQKVKWCFKASQKHVKKTNKPRWRGKVAVIDYNPLSNLRILT